MVGSWFRMFKGDRIRIKETFLGELVQQEMGKHKIELGMPMQDKMLLMQAQENGDVLDEEELLFLAGDQTNTFDADADECDAFDSDVDDEPTAQSIFMANLSSTGPANLQADPSNASILSEVHDLENNIDHCDIDQDEHEIHNEVQQKNIIDSNVANLGNSNVILYEQYLSVNEVSVEPSCAPSVPIDASVLHDNNAYIPHDPLVTELSIYKQQVTMYEQRAKFDLTLHEQKIDEQMHMLIQDRNKKEENLKNELHSVKLQLNSTIKSNTIIEETVTALKHEFKQKETKFLTDFSNLKTLNDKLKNKLYAQDQSIQTVHMMLKPKKLHAQNHFYLRKAKVAQPTLYDGDEILKTHNVPVSVTSSKEDLEIAEITRQKMNEKMNDLVSLVKEVRAMKAVFENMEAEVDQNAIDKKCGEIERKNLLITNENLIANCIAKDVFYTVTDSALSASRFHDLSTAYNVAMTRVVELESENSKFRRFAKGHGGLLISEGGLPEGGLPGGGLPGGGLPGGGSKVLRDFLLHRSSINSSARLSNKFEGFYLSFKFGISGLLHQVITTIAYRIRDKDTSQSKQNIQSSSMTFIHKTLIIPSVLDSCFNSFTVCEVIR
ncbi:hypothetical protein Tco_0424278 [Tanacetum coccineum]